MTKRSIDQLVRPSVQRLKPFSSARAEYEGDADIFLDANENPYNSPHNRYPDPYHTLLRSEIAAWRGVSPDQMLLGNGSDEVIDFIVRAFCEPRIDIIRTIAPTFGMYEVVADINDVSREEVLLDADFDVDVELCLADQTDKHKVLFLCSPNNPTGNDLSREKMVQIIKGWNGIVVVDEAYIDFSDQASLLSDLDTFSNLIVLQTFSKALGAAGLRIGMCYSSVGILQYLIKIKPPYNIGVQTQLSALELMSKLPIYQKQIAEIKTERSRVEAAIIESTGIAKLYKTDSNFLLVRCDRHMELKRYLDNRGIIVRDRSKLVNCASCLRLTIGTPSENDALIEAISNFYKN